MERLKPSRRLSTEKVATWPPFLWPLLAEGWPNPEPGSEGLAMGELIEPTRFSSQNFEIPVKGSGGLDELEDGYEVPGGHANGVEGFHDVVYVR